MTLQYDAVFNIAVGYNNIDLEACSKAVVMATNTPGVLDDTTGDFTWALILATARRLTEAEAYLRNGQWDGWKLKQFLGMDVHHATLDIFGLGRIGQMVARRATGFEWRCWQPRTWWRHLLEKNHPTFSILLESQRIDLR